VTTLGRTIIVHAKLTIIDDVRDAKSARPI